jgi:undecaprenyl phosphate-alpha-L-ara4N flippase subunit ArnE
MTCAVDRRALGYNFLGLSIVLQASTFLCVKFATRTAGVGAAALVGVATVLLLARAAAWQGVLTRLDLSHANPFMALSQVLIFIAAVFVFHEAVALHHVVGLAVMIGGLILLSGTL